MVEAAFPLPLLFMAPQCLRVNSSPPSLRYTGPNHYWHMRFSRASLEIRKCMEFKYRKHKPTLKRSTQLALPHQSLPLAEKHAASLSLGTYLFWFFLFGKSSKLFYHFSHKYNIHFVRKVGRLHRVSQQLASSRYGICKIEGHLWKKAKTCT